jgi:sulfoxide reductase heme-binding subunit YedZ
MVMAISQTPTLKNNLLNGWWLFALIVVPMCVATLVAMSRLDLSSPEAISAMIQFSVRLAVPWLFIAFASSSLVVVFPGQLSKWLLRNRRMIGLCFAAGMAWQLFFIIWLVTGFWGYYLEEAYSYFDLAEQVPGYLVLFAMTVTSFRIGRDRLSSRQWKILHKYGIYFLWAVVWSTYWFELFYYDDVQYIDHIYYWAGFLAWGVRVGAWSKKQVKRRPVQAASGRGESG